MLSVTSAFVATALAIAYPAMAQDSAASTPTPSSGSSAGGVAGLVSGLSSSCQAAAGSLLSSDFGSCANIIGLVSVIGAQGSVVPALNVSHCNHSLLSHPSHSFSRCLPLIDPDLGHWHLFR